MKIEPCAYCGGKMFSMRTGACYCSSCLAIVENCDIAVHNRISRIVRAAEQVTDKYERYFQKRFSYCPMEEFERAEHEYTDSVIRLGEIVRGMPVEGGAE